MAEFRAIAVLMAEEPDPHADHHNLKVEMVAARAVPPALEAPLS